LSKTEELSVIKRQFLASLNHEIRTPLSGILGMTDLLLETSLSGDQKEYVDSVRVCAENLLQILNGALEYSALSANHVRVEENEFPLRETLQGIAAEFLPKAESKGLKLVHNLDPRLPEAAVGDAVRLRQLLVNLLSNAIKFTNAGQVELAACAGRVDASGLALNVAVRDTGVGIAPDRVRSIFEDFQRLHSGAPSVHSGLGLGLAVSHRLVTLMNGFISVESRLGEGSTFSINIPLGLPADISRHNAEPEKTRHRVLVVDDNSVAQTIASHALGRRGYEVECAGDGQAALDAAARKTFDLILLDLQMPGLDGFQTAERLHQMPAYTRVPIVAVTANCSQEYRQRCQQCGMQGFLAKPVRTKDLVRTVEQYCTPALAAN
jgi:CheY-like chemotaxis protein